MPRQLNKKIRVLHVVGSMNAGGLETLIMNIYRQIDKDKVQFDFAVQTQEKCFYDDEIIEMGGKIIPHPKSKVSLKNYKKALEKTIINYGPYDAVHSHVLFFSGLVLGVAKKKDVPIRIAHSHNVNDSRKDSFLRKVYREIMRIRISQNATHRLGASSKACEYLFGSPPQEKKQIILYPNAIDLNKYKNLSRNKSYLTKELNLFENSTLIGHIGRFSKQKNHTFIVKLFSSYVKEDPSAHLILVGEGKEKENIKNLVRDIGIEERVHFLGLRKDVVNILSSIDLFLFPSLYEGLGIVLVEAQAAGTPSLISKNVPPEADLKVELINKLSLKDEDDTWVQEINKTKKLTFESWKKINRALIENGYDIKTSSKMLLEVYSGEK